MGVESRELTYALGYLAAQWLPLMFVPALSLDAWLLVALPLAGLFLARGSNDPLSINICAPFFQHTPMVYRQQVCTIGC